MTEEFLAELSMQIAALHTRQREWIESNADATEPSPYFDLICAVEDMLAELRDTHAEHLAVLSALAAQRGYRSVTEAPELATL